MSRINNANKKVIGLIGEKGAGKGTVSRFLIEKYGAVHYGTSKILRRTIEDLHLPVSRDNLIKLALVLKEGYGPSVIVDSLILDIESGGEELVIADGIRMNGDVEPFRAKYGENFCLVYVTADIRTRYDRTKGRGEKDGEDKASFDQFLAEEARLTEVSIHEIGQGADFVIKNDGTEDYLLEQIDSMVKKFGLNEYLK